MRFEPLGQKMFTRRNWLLRCSILINIAVILYICSHLMIGNRYTLTSGSQFVIQEQPSSAMQQQQQQAERGMVREALAKMVSNLEIFSTWESLNFRFFFEFTGNA